MTNPQATASGPDRRKPPLLLLDVDGVLNAISEQPDPQVWPDWQRGPARTGAAPDQEWPILFSPTVTATIARWHNEGLAEIRWLTTWQENANGDLRTLLGLPAFPVEGMADYDQAHLPILSRALPDPVEALRSHASVAGARAASGLTGRWWKYDAVLRVLAHEPQRPVLWIDDDLRHERRVCAWMREHACALLLSPPSHLGLTPRLLRQAEQWLQFQRDAALDGGQS